MRNTNEVLRLNSSTDEIDLYTWIHNGPDADGVEALAGGTGFGMTGQTNRWFEGAGDGAQWRGARVLPRDMEIPLWIKGSDRKELNELLGRLSLMFNPEYGPVRLTYALPDGELWYTDVVREAGGDYTRGYKDSNRNRWIKSTINLRAGLPYWSRLVPDSIVVQEDISGRGLMPNLAELQVSYQGAFGTFAIFNKSDAASTVEWLLKGPFTEVLMLGPLNERLEWIGSIAEGETLTIRNGTVIDNNGNNRYNGLSASPKFWKIAPGNATVTVVMEGTNSATRAIGQWSPRKWAVA